jgi:thiol-disulfide isomerase/thioredoxin
MFQSLRSSILPIKRWRIAPVAGGAVWLAIVLAPALFEWSASLRAVHPKDSTIVEADFASTTEIPAAESTGNPEAPTSSPVQDGQQEAGAVESVKDYFSDLEIAPDADRGRLEQVVANAKAARPRSADQYHAQQTAIREASSRLMEMMPPEDPAFGQTEMDSIIASVSLMAFFEDEEQEDIVDRLKELLASREQVSMQDVQTGVLAAGMIELQPDKRPAIELYEFLDKCLEMDSREEMQSFRLNLQASIRRLNLLGNRLELDAVTIDGNKITTDDFKGKFVIVDVFATWCAPCLVEAELIASHYKKYKDKGLEVIGISLDENKEDLLEYLDKKPLPWPVIHDSNEDPLQRLAMKFGISALPTVLLLNKEGTVVSLEARQSELNRLMQILFESPTPASELEQVEEETEKESEKESAIESPLEGNQP